VAKEDATLIRNGDGVGVTPSSILEVKAVFIRLAAHGRAASSLAPLWLRGAMCTNGNVGGITILRGHRALTASDRENVTATRR